jgi:hypothetical protein
VAEQLVQGNASTALTFNMHCLTMLMTGQIADNIAMPPAVRERHEKLRATKFREVVVAPPERWRSGWDHEFESSLLQRRVSCEPDFLL